MEIKKPAAPSIKPSVMSKLSKKTVSTVVDPLKTVDVFNLVKDEMNKKEKEVTVDHLKAEKDSQCIDDSGSPEKVFKSKSMSKFIQNLVKDDKGAYD